MTHRFDTRKFKDDWLANRAQSLGCSCHPIASMAHLVRILYARGTLSKTGILKMIGSCLSVMEDGASEEGLRQWREALDEAKNLPDDETSTGKEPT